jgi:pyridoxine kinase
MAVLSIQSHVTYGYVGNRAATFPLQRMGHEVLTVNTVQFSNHTGYGKWKGEVFTAEHIKGVLQGMDELGILSKCEAVLSGYLGDCSIGKEVMEAVRLCRECNPDIIYLCDPVMGDLHRGVFVRPAIPDFMRDVAIRAADIITPNHFEMELLSGRRIHTSDEAFEACEQMAAHPQQIILITSFMRKDMPKDTLEVFLYSRDGCYLISTPLLHFPKSIHGTGDLFAALYLGHYLKTKDIVASLESAVSSIFSILELSCKLNSSEMELIKGQDYISRPEKMFKAHPCKASSMQVN